MKKGKTSRDYRIGTLKRLSNVTIGLSVISLIITSFYIVFSDEYQPMIIIMLGLSGGFLLATLISNFWRSLLIAKNEVERKEKM